MLLTFPLTALLLVMPASTLQPAGFSSEDPQLPDCSVVLNSAANTEQPPDLVLLSTLDGKVTAVDSSGSIVWQLDTGPTMLSSSPKTLFLENSRGETATCIPSLDGSLYIFDGKNIQLFVTAELLLQNSLKSGQSLLTGGTEIKTFGVNLRTGQIRYICSGEGECVNLTDSEEKVGTAVDGDEVVVIRRHTQTVRAIEPRSGKERWHFSVAENELLYVPKKASCGQKPIQEVNASKSSETVRILASKGVVTSSKRDKNEVDWTLQLSSPVVGVWKLENSRLREVDLFEPSNIIGMDESGPKPFLHLGIFQQQLYMYQNRKHGNQELPAIDKEVRLMLEHGMAQPSQHALAPISEGSSTALISQILETLHENNEFDAGIYFVQEEVDECSSHLLLPPSDTSEHIDEIATSFSENVSADLNPEESAEQAPIIYVVYSIWHYWKEICAISIVCSVALNVCFTKLLAMFGIQAPSLIPSVPSSPQISEPTISTVHNSFSKTVPASVEELLPNQALAATVEAKTQGNSFSSRFANDFEPIRCLGRGGFGIVFESKNRIDDCSYAIKRIRLPSKQAAREKVLREVKALAKLDHPHIVRYYNAWLESPPPGWQEAIDEKWKSSLPLSATNALSNEIGTVATAATESATRSKDHILPLTAVNPLRPFDDLFYDQTARSNLQVNENNRSTSGSWYNGDDEDHDDSDDRGDRLRYDNATDHEDSIVFQSSSGDNSIVFESNSPIQKNASKLASERKKGPNLTPEGSKPPVQKRPSCLQLEEIPSTQPVYLYIQMQLCRKESLKEWLACRATLDDRGHDKVLDIFFQIAAAVEYVHECGLIHRDLKPSNIFFATSEDIVKVGDFGLVTGADSSSTGDITPGGVSEADLSSDCNFGSVQLTDKVGTQLYMSPEQVNGNKYNQKIDIFSLGLIFFELLWSLPTQMERVNTLTAVKQIRFPKSFKKSFPTEFELVRRMVAADPNTRPSAIEVRKHSLFDEFRKELAIVRRRRTASTGASVSSQDNVPPQSQQ